MDIIREIIGVDKMFNVTKLLIFSSVLIIVGCSKKEQLEPVFNIKGIKTSIVKIQLSPLAFDRAQVVVLGFVKEIKSFEDDRRILLITDEYGNSINVEFLGVLEFKENDTVVVGGKYSKNRNVIISEEVVKVILDKDGIKPAGDLRK